MSDTAFTTVMVALWIAYVLLSVVFAAPLHAFRRDTRQWEVGHG